MSERSEAASRPVVLVTRSAQDCEKLRLLLAPCGIQVKPYPVTRVVDRRDPTAWKRLAQISGDPPSMLVFTSRHAPSRFREQALQKRREDLLKVPAAAVGETTASAARSAGFSVELVGAGTTAELAKALAERLPTGSWVLWPCGKHRSMELPSILKSRGIEPVPVVVYEAVAAPPAELPPLGPRLDAVALTSPRCARLYLESIGGKPLPCPHFALGPATAEAAKWLGIKCFVPPQPTIDSLAEEICARLKEDRED